jgi:hypothetical protein
MGRKRGFMKKDKAFPSARRDRGQAVVAWPPLPVKLHQMGEPILPRPGRRSCARRRSGRRIELNTNCGLITPGDTSDGLYAAGIRQPHPVVPDARSLELQDPPKRRAFLRHYREKVSGSRSAQGGDRARTILEIDSMNSSTRRYGDREARHRRSRPQDWILFAQELRAEVRPPAHAHDWARSAPRTSWTRTRTAAATRCCLACTSSGSAATRGAT